jgi:hypothetical protein
MRVQYECNIATLIIAKILALAFSFLPQRFSTFGAVNHTKPSREKLTEAIKGIISKLEICYERISREKTVRKDGNRTLPQP